MLYPLVATVQPGRQNILPLWIAYFLFTLVFPALGIGLVADHFGRSFWRWGLLGAPLSSPELRSPS
ncbi:MAG: hypothetical protein WDA27_14475 [Actinomycetota bacterium]